MDILTPLYHDMETRNRIGLSSLLNLFPGSQLLYRIGNPVIFFPWVEEKPGEGNFD